MDWIITATIGVCCFAAGFLVGTWNAAIEERNWLRELRRKYKEGEID